MTYESAPETSAPVQEFFHNAQYSAAVGRLREALDVSDMTREQEEQVFESAVQAVKALLVDPKDEIAVDSVAARIHWRLFEPPDKAPPDNYAVSVTNEHGYTHATGYVDLSYSTSIGDENTIVSELYNHGLQSIADARLKGRSALGPEIGERVQEVVDHSSIGTFMRSFGDAQRQMAERPLTEVEKQMRMVRAEYDVRQRFAISPGEAIHSYTHAGKLLARTALQLDEETVVIARESDDGLQRAKDFFEAAKQEYAERKGDKCIEWRPDEQGYSFTIYNDFIDDMWERLGTNDLAHKVVGKYLLMNFDKLIMGGVPLEQAIISSTNVAIQMLLAELANYESSRSNAAHLFLGATNHKKATTRHENYYRTITFLNEGKGENSAYTSDTAGIVSEESYDKLKNRTLAQVERGQDLLGAGLRLAELVPFSHRYSRERVKTISNDKQAAADLVLSHPALLQDSFDIIGFELIGRDGAGRSFYRYDAEYDPYRPADIPMPGTRLTVQEYTRGQAQQSEYVFEISPEDLLRPGIGISKDKYQVQCSGAAFLLSDALKVAFPDNRVDIVSGFCIDPLNGTMTAAGHAQVALYVDGNKYMLDATPGEATAGLDEPIGRRSSRPFKQLLGKVASKPELPTAEKPDGRSNESPAGRRIPLLKRLGMVASRPQKPPEGKPVKQEQPEPEQLTEPAVAIIEIIERTPPPPPTPEEIRAGLCLRLRAIYGAPNDTALYERIAKLPQADPVRRTLQAVMQVQASGEAPDVDRLKDYLSNLHGADAALRKRIGINDYSSGTLRMLQNFAQQLASAQPAVVL